MEGIRKKESIFTSRLMELRDEEYQIFQSKLTPNLSPEVIIGVRIPKVRLLAKELLREQAGQVEEFLGDLPHYYYDENNLHGLFLAEEKSFERVIERLESFLPHIDNWATCDIIHPKIFKRHKEELLPWILKWLESEHEYTLRFGIGTLMTYYMDKDFKEEYLEWVADVHNKAYYVQMMVAWYFATALTKQYESTLPILEKKILLPWTQNKAVQKARESRRIAEDRKAYLKSLKCK